MDEIECVVVGAGAVGLACARALALAGHEVVVLERAPTIGFETSSRNSEVIHSGLYYPAGSLKAKTCVAGRERLYALLLRARGGARPARQADRRGGRGRNPRSRKDRRGRPRQRRRQSRMARRRGGATSRAGVALRGRAVVALDRDHRQPCADARLSGRGRSGGGDRRAAHAGAGGTGAQRRVRARHRRRRAQPLCIAGTWSMPPGCMRPPSPPPSTASRGRRSRPPISAAASISPCPGRRRFTGWFIRCRRRMGSACI